jgi:hypothetical protein
MAHDQRPSRFGIRHQVILLFFLLALFIVAPTLSFIRWWFVASQEQVGEKLLSEGYKTFIAYVDQKRDVLETLARSFVRHPAVRSLAAGSGAVADPDI